MRNIIQDWMIRLLVSCGLTLDQAHSGDQWVILGLIVLIAVLTDVLSRIFLLKVVRRIVVRTAVAWDDIIFNEQVLRRACHIITPVMISILLPLAFLETSSLLPLLMKLLNVYILAMVYRLVSSLLQALYHVAEARPSFKGKPLKGLVQTGQVVTFCICIIWGFSILLDKSPAILLTGLGASAAVLMLIFKDSILGFVSGVQLSANNMLSVGDWITMPKYGADGTVIEVTLNTVKVRNWDNTVVTLPPYLLVSDSFQNWQAMRRSGGRRVKRSINIDISSIRFCTPEMIERFSRIALLKDYLSSFAKPGDAPEADSDVLNTPYPTNVGIFRYYLSAYLKRHDMVRKDMLVIVRQLQPTQYGLPMELYFFLDTVDWVPYERLQADIFDQVFAIVPEFGLRVYQTPSGSDIHSLNA